MIKKSHIQTKNSLREKCRSRENVKKIKFSKKYIKNYNKSYSIKIAAYETMKLRNFLINLLLLLFTLKRNFDISNKTTQRDLVKTARDLVKSEGKSRSRQILLLTQSALAKIFCFEDRT